MKRIIIGIFSWIQMPFFWSEWKDIQTFHWASDGYLLQGRVNLLSNAKQFRVTKFKQLFTIAETPNITLEKLKSIGL